MNERTAIGRRNRAIAGCRGSMAPEGKLRKPRKA
jgi:hypothetical protein